jgi:hypothetical protein
MLAHDYILEMGHEVELSLTQESDHDPQPDQDQHSDQDHHSDQDPHSEVESDRDLRSNQASQQDQDLKSAPFLLDPDLQDVDFRLQPHQDPRHRPKGTVP